MKSCACLLVAVGALVAAEVRGQEPDSPRLNVSPQELDRLLNDPQFLRPNPVIDISDRGVRVFNSEAERDRALTQEAQERRALEESVRRWVSSQRAQQQARASEASWKLGVLGVGLLLGLLLAVFGRR